MKRSVRKFCGVIILAGVIVSCGGSDSSPATEAPVTEAPATDAPATEGVLNVPADYPTIQGAVDAAVEGDLILIAPGTYTEAVQVTTNNIIIRGLDRNTVILDGNFELDNGIRVVGANGVALENMTAMNYTKNGFFWTGVTGYRGDYLTAWRNGDDGVARHFMRVYIGFRPLREIVVLAQMLFVGRALIRQFLERGRGEIGRDPHHFMHGNFECPLLPNLGKFLFDAAAHFRDTDLMHQDFDPRLVDVVAPSRLVVDAHSRFEE